MHAWRPHAHMQMHSPWHKLGNIFFNSLYKLLSTFLSTKLSHIASGIIWIAVGLGIIDQFFSVTANPSSLRRLGYEGHVNFDRAIRLNHRCAANPKKIPFCFSASAKLFDAALRHGHACMASTCSPKRSHDHMH